MLADIIQEAVEIILKDLLGFVFYHIGRMVVPVISFGRWRCGRFTTQLVGLLTIALVVGCLVLIWYLRS